MLNNDLWADKDRPWRDAEVLEYLYHDEGLTQSEVADVLDTVQTTVQRWMNKHDIDARSRSEANISDERLLDEDWLREQYSDNGRTAYDIADDLGCSKTAVLRAIHRADIEPHSQAVHKKTIHPTFDLHHDGYVRVTSHDYVDGELANTDQIRLHRLLAVAEYGFEAVQEKDVHHVNHIPWDNRPENIELPTRAEHKRHHANIYWENTDVPWE